MRGGEASLLEDGGLERGGWLGGAVLGAKIGDEAFEVIVEDIGALVGVHDRCFSVELRRRMERRARARCRRERTVPMGMARMRATCW